MSTKKTQMSQKLNPRNNQLEEIYETERQTDRHTRNPKQLENSQEMSQECMQKF